MLRDASGKLANWISTYARKKIAREGGAGKVFIKNALNGLKKQVLNTA